MCASQDKSRMPVCTHCGRGFILTPTYLDLLKRRGARVVVPVLCPTCFLVDGPLPKERGQVKWFNQGKRYGFITAESGEEVFFHREQLLGGDKVRPREGQAVRFHLHYPIRGPEALNVELMDG